MREFRVSLVSGTRVFASFDALRDRDLYERLLAEAGEAGLGIDVSGGSEPFAATDGWSQRARGRIREAERVLVICGEHTDESIGVEAELRIAREEGKPYLLLWGRRDLMCTKPAGARPTDGIYTWTPPTLQEQFALMSRVAQREAAAIEMRRRKPSPASAPRPDS
jgi:hypothetical protein